MDKSLFAKLTLILNALGAIGILLMVLFINLDVFGRTVFNAPLPGVTEFIGLAIVAVVWLQAASTLRNHRFIRSDVLSSVIDRKFPRFGSALRVLFNLIGFSVCAAILRFSVTPTINAYERGYYKGTFGVFTIPVWPVKVIIFIGCATLAIQFLLHAYQDFKLVFKSVDSETIS